MTGRRSLLVPSGLCACVWVVVALLHVIQVGALVYVAFGVGVVSTIVAGWSILHKWFNVPRIQGTWWGVLRSSYSDPVSDRTSSPIQVAFVIRQSAENMSLRMHSQESSSTTIVASLVSDDEHLEVVGVYRNEPRLPRQDTSRPHYGGIKLQVVQGAVKRLYGTYWTDRGTWGEIDLHFVTAIRAQSFLDASEMAAREGLLESLAAQHAGSAWEGSLPAVQASPAENCPPPTSVTPDEALCKLLESRFSVSALRRFIANVASRDAVARLPAEGTSLADLAFAVVTLLHRDRLLDKVFEHLREHPPKSPTWSAEVERVRGRFSD